jgi:hypothetical protein
MVTITSTGLSVEDAKDAAGSTANDGLTYDDVTNEFDVVPGNALTIDGSKQVAVVQDDIDETVLAYDFVGGG